MTDQELIEALRNTGPYLFPKKADAVMEEAATRLEQLLKRPSSNPETHDRACSAVRFGQNECDCGYSESREAKRAED